MGTPATTAERAVRLLYGLHNSGHRPSVARMQRIARIAYMCGSRAIMVLCYTNGR